jgi:DNA end-binding protein Ku
MAEQLIEDMSTDWKPEDYEDRTREEIMALVHEKMDKGEIKRVEAPAEGAADQGAEIIDLTELLKRSLGGKAKGGDKDKPEDKAAAHKPARKTAAAKRAAPAKKTTQAAHGERAAAKGTPRKAAARKRA